MFKQVNRKVATQKRHRRIRKTLYGTAAKPRLAVYRSNKHICAQLIDDMAQMTLASASSNEKALRESLTNGGNTDAARQIGQLIATRAQEKGISEVVFDRGGNLYHGRIQVLADAAREAGLQF